MNWLFQNDNVSYIYMQKYKFDSNNSKLFNHHAELLFSRKSVDTQHFPACFSTLY